MVLGYDTPSRISTWCRSWMVTLPRSRIRLLPRNSMVYCWAGLPEVRNRSTELSAWSRSRAAKSLRSRRMRGDSCMTGATPSGRGEMGRRQGRASRPAGDDLGIDDQVVTVLDARLDERHALDQATAPLLVV